MENESLKTALAKLEMLYQAAKGDYSPKPQELEKHRLAVIAFLRTGQCKIAETDRAMASAVSDAVQPFLQAERAQAIAG